MDSLKPLVRLRWNAPGNLHITTKFIGEWPEYRIPELRKHMPTEQPEPEITVSGVGFFPNERFPKVLFARVEASDELLALAQATDAAMRALGIPFDKHPYRPHVTLARIPMHVHLHPLRDRLEELNPGLFGKFAATEYALYESSGGLYKVLERYSLRTAQL